jgi:proliferating cell nuclear antigen
MFHAVIPKAITLKKIIEAIKELVNDVNIETSDHGISLQAMDASHVALVTLNLKVEAFNEFNCNESQILGINISNLSKILKCADNDDRVTIEVEPKASKLKFIFEGKLDDKLSEFNLNLINLDSEQLGIPDQEYSAVIHMKSDEFSRVCRELSQISDTLLIDVNKQRVKFSVGGDMGEGSISLKHRETGKFSTCITANEDVRCSYAMRYLNLFNKASGITEEVTLSVSENLPLVMDFDFQVGSIKYYLAPKVNDE